MKSIMHAICNFAVAALIIAAAASPARASDISILGGETLTSRPAATSYSWQLEYRQDLLKHLSAGFSYLNEGHIKQHHRDGYTAQLWADSKLLDNRLMLAAGVGPYFFLDTTSDSSADGFTNHHGWRPMLSVDASWQLENKLLLELRGNWVKWSDGFDSATILAGIGYRFDPPAAAPAPPGAVGDRNNEITLFLGQTIVNSFNSPHSVAASLEYRRHLWRHVDWTAAGLYEGDNRLVRRDGVITELWAVQQLLEELSIGAGAGAYIDIGHYENPFIDTGTNRFISGIATLTCSYRFAGNWAVRGSWNRVITRYQRDTDIILGGIGYLF